MTLDELLARLNGVRQSGDGWTARCPAHEDDENSLSVGEGDHGRILLKCFAGCEVEAIVRALRIELRDLFPRSEISVSARESHAVPTGLTLAELSAAKKLPIEFLTDLGLEDTTYGTRPAVRIPYLSPASEIIAVRFRLAMEGKRFAWRTKDKVQVYGLQRLTDFRKLGSVLLVEGESDCWTAWFHGIPALGLPGKSTWKENWRHYVSGIQVYLWEEPEADDLTRSIGKDLPGLLVLRAPEGIKDLSEAHLQGKSVPNFIDELKKTAVTLISVQKQETSARGEELKEAAKSVLESPDPLELIKTELVALGYGGDPRYPLIVYIAATSRLLAMRTGAMPVHLLLLGISSAGKSYTLKIVLRLLPKEAFHTIDAGSPRVLIYDPEELRHRVAVFSEADSLPAGEDNPAASAIRNLLQDHYLHYKVTVKESESGGFTVREVEKEGPTVLITTATKRLGPQLDTRIFSLEVPEDQEQVRKALRTQAELEIHGVPEPSESIVAFQGYLQTLAPWDVVVPFADILSEAIGRSIAAPRILRDYQRLLSLLKAVAILRHRHRKRDEKGRLVATVEDYRAVYDLVAEMYEGTATGASANVRKVVEAVAKLHEEGKTPVSLTDVADRLGLHKGSVSRFVRVALRNGWLCNTQEKKGKGKGKPYQLIVGERLPESLGLPHPSLLEGGVAGLQAIPADDGGGDGLEDVAGEEGEV